MQINIADLPGHLYVRFEPDERGRLRPRDLFLEGTDAPISARHLRQIPLGDIEASANGPEQAGDVRDRLKLPGPDLRSLADAFSRTVSTHRGRSATGTAAEVRGRTDWVSLALLSQFPDEFLRQRQLVDEGERMPRPRKPRRRGAPAPPEFDDEGPRPPIQRPEGRALPDEFLLDVAHAYVELAKAGQRPAPVIAEEADVPITTVHRWIREARRRGLLASGRRGATG